MTAKIVEVSQDAFGWLLVYARAHDGRREGEPVGAPHYYKSRTAAAKAAKAINGPTMKDVDFDPELVLAGALRVRGADLVELAGHVMADRARDGRVGSYAIERIGKAIADLAAEFAKFQAAQKGDD